MPQLSTDSQPIDFLLKSFNALDTDVANDPTKILYHLLDFRRAPVAESQVTRSEHAVQMTSEYLEDESAESSYTNITASLGLEGKFGMYSGSCQVNAEKEQETSSKTSHSNFRGFLSCGTLLFYRSDSPKDIAAGLNDEVITALNGISTLAQAEAFTRTYGTHVLLGVNLGGLLSMIVQITSTSFSDKQKLSIEAKAAYNGIGGNISAVAKANSEVRTAASGSTLKQEMKVMGGSLDAVAHLKIDDAASIESWMATCGTASVSGLCKAVELWTLAQNATAHATLKQYLDLCLLKHSVENPVVFSAFAPIVRGQYNPVSAAADTDYKIISGGAWLDENSSNFLTASCPVLDSDQTISAWKAVSHDCMLYSSPADYIAAYAVGVYDPANLLSVSCVSAPGANPPPAIGGDAAYVQLGSRFTLTGGGGETGSSQEYARYLTSTFPLQSTGAGAETAGSYRGWVAQGHDYANASAAALHAWVVGIAPTNLSGIITISNTVVRGEGGQQSHGTSFATLGNDQKIAGGGVQLVQPDGIDGDSTANLLHATFPTSQQGQFGWQEFNGDLNGVFDKVTATAFAITLKVNSQVSGVTFQPYGARGAATATR